MVFFFLLLLFITTITVAIIKNECPRRQSENPIFPVRAPPQGSLLVCGPEALHRKGVEQQEAELDT